MRTRQHRITDILNLADQPFLILEDVTVEELGDRAGRRSSADVAQINLDSVLFAVANVPIEASPELRTPKKPTEAIVSVPPFQITGHDPPDARRVDAPRGAQRAAMAGSCR